MRVGPGAKLGSSEKILGSSPLSFQVVPLEWLQYFDERELELIICGMQNIDVEVRE